METFTLSPIGHVRNRVVSPVDSGWGAVESRIVLEPQWTGALDGLAEFSHVQILTYLHQIAAEDQDVPAQRRPRGRADMPLLGVFAQRARVRPNPIGLTACAIVAAKRGELIVRGLDAIDGTPVLDIKPYAPGQGAATGVKVPDWAKPM